MSWIIFNILLPWFCVILILLLGRTHSFLFTQTEYAFPVINRLHSVRTLKTMYILHLLHNIFSHNPFFSWSIESFFFLSKSLGLELEFLKATSNYLPTKNQRFSDRLYTADNLNGCSQVQIGGSVKLVYLYHVLLVTINICGIDCKKNLKTTFNQIVN
jgi:hypothetical protein